MGSSGCSRQDWSPTKLSHLNHAETHSNFKFGCADSLTIATRPSTSFGEPVQILALPDPMQFSRTKLPEEPEVCLLQTCQADMESDTAKNNASQLPNRITKIQAASSNTATLLFFNGNQPQATTSDMERHGTTWYDMVRPSHVAVSQRSKASPSQISRRRNGRRRHVTVRLASNAKKCF